MFVFRGVAFVIEALALGELLLGAPRRGPATPSSLGAAATAGETAMPAGDDAASICSRESKGWKASASTTFAYSQAGSCAGQVRAAVYIHLCDMNCVFIWFYESISTSGYPSSSAPFLDRHVYTAQLHFCVR